MDETVAQDHADDINPRVQLGPRAAALGIMGVRFRGARRLPPLHRYRLARARQALRNPSSARSLSSTSTISATSPRPKSANGSATSCAAGPCSRAERRADLVGFRLRRRAYKLYVPWLKPENCKAGLIGLRGTVAPAFGLMQRHAQGSPR